MTENVILCYRNYTLPGTLYGGSWEPNMPLTNLQNQQPSRKARSTDATEESTQFVLDCGELRSLRVFALIRHSATQEAQWRVRVAQEAGTSGYGEDIIYDSGYVDMWPEVIPFGVLDWGVFNWGQAIDASEVDAVGPYAIIVLPEVIIGKIVEVYIRDTANPDGYVDVGVFYASDGWQPENNMSYGWELDAVDFTDTATTRSGQRWFDTGPQLRRLRLDLGYITEDEGKSEALQIVQVAQKSNGVLAIPKPADPLSTLRESVYGTLDRWNGKQQWVQPFYRRRFDVLELR